MKFAQAILAALIGGAALAAAAPTVATAESGEQAPLAAPKAAPKSAKAGPGLKAGANSVANPHHKVKGQRVKGQGHHTQHSTQHSTQHGHSRHSQKTKQGNGRHTGTNEHEVATHPAKKTALPKESAQPAQPAQPALTAREYMDEMELFVRALEEELYTRDYFEDELDARDYFEDELDARDFEEELDAREFDYELDARDFEEELEARGVRSWIKKKFGGNRNVDPNAGAPTDLPPRDVENDLEARGSGQHHCPEPGCGSLKQRCIKKGHVEICDTHGTPHIPGDKCVSCQAVEDAAARAAAKKKGKK